MCICDPTQVDGHSYHPWIASHFNECIYSPLDFYSFILGLVSVAFFLIALPPQIYTNYKRKAVHGLSLLLLSAWTLGDLANFLGTILTGQLFFQKILGLYFLLLDMTICGQYFYYTKMGTPSLKDSSTLSDEDINENSELLHNENPTSTTNDATTISPSGKKRSWIGVVAIVLSLSTTGMAKEYIEEICSSSPFDGSLAMILGSVFAWGSGLLYFFSRIPQIRVNYETKSVQGLSTLLFLFTIISNISYGLSVLLRFPPLDSKFFLSTVPYLFGSMGTLVFDVIIMYQIALYGKH